DLHTELVRSVAFDTDGDAPDRLGTVLEELTAVAARDLSADRSGLGLERSVDVRSPRQAHEITVPLPDGAVDADALHAVQEEFFRRHRDAFGVGDPGPVEVVSVRLRATLGVPHARFARPSAPDRAAPARPRNRAVWDA